MIVYYAHSVHLYGTEQEQRDMRTLKQLGFEVVNPSIMAIQVRLDMAKEKYNDAKGEVDFAKCMEEVFYPILDECDALAYRAHIDGKISTGVGTELKYMISRGKPIFELPTIINSKFLSVEDTAEYLKYLGKR